MQSITLLGILFLIIYALKTDKKHEETHRPNAKYLDDEWEDYVPESGPTEKWSIEPLINHDYHVMQKLEKFCIN